MLRTLPEERKSQWSNYVNKVVHAYNCTRNEATGYSPFYLLFGRSPRLPIDLIFNIERTKETTNHLEFVNKWKSAMQEAYSLAAKNANKSTARGRNQHDKKATFTKLLPGDRILVRNVTERGGPGKLRSFWEKTVYRVTKQHGDSPVHEAESGSGNQKAETEEQECYIGICCYPVISFQLQKQQPSSTEGNQTQLRREHQKRDTRKRNKMQLQTRILIILIVKMMTFHGISHLVSQMRIRVMKQLYNVNVRSRIHLLQSTTTRHPEIQHPQFKLRIHRDQHWKRKLNLVKPNMLMNRLQSSVQNRKLK